MIRRVPIWYLGTHKLETFLSFEKSSLLELKQSYSQSTYLLATIFAFQGVLCVESIPATLPQPLQLHVQIPLAASKNPSWRAFPKQKRLDDGYAAWEQAKRSLGFLKGHSSGLRVSSWCWPSPTCSPSQNLTSSHGVDGSFRNWIILAVDHQNITKQQIWSLEPKELCTQYQPMEHALYSSICFFQDRS